MPTRWEYVVGKPVQWDVREFVRNYVATGRPGGRLGVQTLVRGHWKHQPCGPQSKERRFIHIEPHWRGPDNAPIAVRPHILKGSPTVGEEQTR